MSDSGKTSGEYIESAFWLIVLVAMLAIIVKDTTERIDRFESAIEHKQALIDETRTCAIVWRIKTDDAVRTGLFTKLVRAQTNDEARIKAHEMFRLEHGYEAEIILEDTRRVFVTK